MDPRPAPAPESPRATGAAAIPDAVWAPIASAVLVLAAGVASLLVGRPWLFPSLGPTGFLIAETPDHPSARAWNTLVGHLGGLAAGFLALAVLRAGDDPTVMSDHVLTPGRMAASVVAIALTVLVGVLLQASHPPAAATTLLVTLGGIRDLPGALSLFAGVIVVTVVGEGVKALRRQGRAAAPAPSERSPGGPYRPRLPGRPRRAG